MSDVITPDIAALPTASSTNQTPRRGASWQPVDLAGYMSSSYQKPRPTIGAVDNSDIALFLPGRLSTLFGESGGGKTFFMLHVMKEEIDKGHDVVYVDYEDAAETAIHRLHQLGASNEEILRHLIYIQPREKWCPQAEKDLTQRLSGRDVRLVVVDSVGESIAVEGYNPNADDEVARWFSGAARYFTKEIGAAVVLLDHVTKANTRNRDNDYAAGSLRKRAAIDGAAYSLHVITPASRTSDGEFEFITRKCRNGWRTNGHIAASVRMVNGANGRVSFTVSQPGCVTRKPFSPSRCMKEVSAFLETEARAMSKSEIGKNIRFNTNVVSAAIDELVRGGYCTQTEGPRKAKLITFAKAYVDDGESAARSGNPF